MYFGVLFSMSEFLSSIECLGDFFYGILILFFYIIFLFSPDRYKQRLTQYRSGLHPVKDLPVVEKEWNEEESVFEEPEKFGFQIYTEKYDQELDLTQSSLRECHEKRIELLNSKVSLNYETTEKLVSLLQGKGLDTNTTITTLIDHSGSMRRKIGTCQGQNFKDGIIVNEDSGAAVSAGIALSMALAFEKCGITTEILGFTTKEWQGGLSRKDWVKAGRAPYPGRLNDLLHIIYKKADDVPVSECSDRLTALLNPYLLKENIDGEAISWARKRLISQAKKDRLLIFLSDGASVDDSTLNENGPGYLERHLLHVLTDIENRKEMRIVGVGIGYDISFYVPQSIQVKSNETDFANEIEKLATLILDFDSK